MKKILLFPLMFFMITNCFMAPGGSSNNTHSDDTPVDPTPTPTPPPHPSPYTPVPHPSADDQVKEICQTTPNFICTNILVKTKKPITHKGNISFAITTDQYTFDSNETIINFSDTDKWEQGWTIPAVELKKIQNWVFYIKIKFDGPESTSDVDIHFIDDKGRQIAYSKNKLNDFSESSFNFVTNGAISGTMVVEDDVDFDNIKTIFPIFVYTYGSGSNFCYSYAPPIYITH